MKDPIIVRCGKGGVGGLNPKEAEGQKDEWVWEYFSIFRMKGIIITECRIRSVQLGSR